MLGVPLRTRTLTGTVTMETPLMPVLMVVMAMTFRVDAEAACAFPDGMYVTDTSRPWRIMSHDPEVNVSNNFRKVLFNERSRDRFTVEYYARSNSRRSLVPSYTQTYRCINAAPDPNTYLVAKEYPGVDTKYMCLQFVARSRYVVQWATSVERNDMIQSMCMGNEKLTFRDDPLVLYYESLAEEDNFTFDKCPFEGGYITSWIDPRTGKNMCINDIPPLKMENECEVGEGLVFHTTHDHSTCRGHDAQMLNSRFICLAHWEQGQYTFIVMVRENDLMNSVHCMRLPVGYGDLDRFEAQMFLDGTSDTSEPVISQNYRKLSLYRYPVNSICEDETDKCLSLPSAHLCEIAEAEICRKHCGVCSIDEVGDEGVVAPDEYLGMWLLALNTTHGPGVRDDNLVVLEKQVFFHDTKAYNIVGISNCNRHIDNSPTGQSKEFLLLSQSSNGCSPRLTGMMIAKRSPSVMSYTLSKSIPATVMNSVQLIRDENGAVSVNYHIKEGHWGKRCKALEYGSDVGYDTFHPRKNSWYNVINPKSSMPTVNCDLPLNMSKFKRHFTLRTSGGDKCKGLIENDQSSPDRFSVNVESCSYEPLVKQTMVKIEKKSFKYVCLASFLGEMPNRQYVIVERGDYIRRLQRSKGEIDDTLWGKDYLCWLFLSDKDEVLIFPHSKCDANSERDMGETPSGVLFLVDPPSNAPLMTSSVLTLLLAAVLLLPSLLPLLL